MNRRVDHTLVDPRVEAAHLAWDLGEKGIAEATFGVLAEAEDVRLVAKICFVSYLLGPGQKIILSRHNLED